MCCAKNRIICSKFRSDYAILEQNISLLKLEQYSPKMRDKDRAKVMVMVWLGLGLRLGLGLGLGLG